MAQLVSNSFIIQTDNPMAWANCGIFQTLQGNGSGVRIDTVDTNSVPQIEVYIGNVANPNTDSILSGQVNIQTAAIAGYNFQRFKYNIPLVLSAVFQLNAGQAIAGANLWVRIFGYDGGLGACLAIKAGV